MSSNGLTESWVGVGGRTRDLRGWQGHASCQSRLKSGAVAVPLLHRWERQVHKPIRDHTSYMLACGI